MSICNIDNTYKFSYLYGIRAPTLMSISDPIFFFATLISHLLWLLPPTPSFKSQPSITSRSNSLQLISQYGDSIPIKMIIDKRYHHTKSSIHNLVSSRSNHLPRDSWKLLWCHSTNDHILHHFYGNLGSIKQELCQPISF